MCTYTHVHVYAKATGKQQQFERAFKVAQVQVENVVEVAKVLNARGSKAFRAGEFR